MRSILLITAVLFCAAASAQTIWFVDGSATPPGDGSAATPFVHIADAMLAASDGDVVRVARGIYAENLPSPGKTLHIRSTEGAAVTRVMGVGVAAPVFTFVGPTDDLCTLTGFTISGGRGQILASAPQFMVGGGVFCDEAAPTIRSCIFENNQVTPAVGWGIGGGIGYVGTGPEVIRCLFRNNYAATSGGGVGGLFPPSGVRTGIYDSVFHDNLAGEGAAIATHEAEIYVANCTLVENTATFTGGALHAEIAGQEQKFVNTIMRDNLPNEVVVYDGATPELIHCDVKDGWLGLGFGNYDGDPRFCDMLNKDYRTLAGSTSHDAGLAGVAGLEFDFWGNPRVSGDAIDVGAHEYEGDFLLVCGRGNYPDVNGDAFDTFSINGTSGGVTRRVDVGVSTALTFGMVTPPGVPGTGAFAIFGMVGVPVAADRRVVSVGEMCFPLFFLEPGNPALFLLAPVVLPTSITPWTFTFGPGVPTPIQVTLQGLLYHPGHLRYYATNGMILSVI